MTVHVTRGKGSTLTNILVGLHYPTPKLHGHKVKPASPALERSLERTLAGARAALARHYNVASDRSSLPSGTNSVTELANGPTAPFPFFDLLPSGTYSCDAAALELSLLGSAPTTSGVANLNDATCKDADVNAASLPGSLPLPITLHALEGITAVTGGASPAAGATGGLLGLGVGVGGTPLAALTAPILQQLLGNTTPVTFNQGLVGTLLSVLGIGGSGTSITGGDLTGALQNVLDGVLSNVLNGEIVALNVAQANVKADCTTGTGTPSLSGNAQLAGLSVLGIPIPLDGTVDPILNLLNTENLDQLNINSVVNELLPGVIQTLGLQSIATGNGLLAPVVNELEQNLAPELQNALGPVLTPVLTALQPLLNSLIDLQIHPDVQTQTSTSLAEEALTVQLKLLGQNILGGVLGEARINTSAVTCPTAAPAAVLALQCTSRKLTLINVLQDGNHVDLLGAAQQSLDGQTVKIISTYNGKVVAEPKVNSSGFFQATAPLPPSSIRDTNSARYEAEDTIGQKSLDLKLTRRMIVDSIASNHGQVTLHGQVVKPLATTSTTQTIYVQRRVSCTTETTVKSVHPNAKGYWSVTVAAPPNAQAAVYRAETKVRKDQHNSKLFPTFTLPREVEIS
ncbi:MAG TPA: hypothetical protein VHX88_01980 [Solirubrobacteraceae bacterium]|nr:hypothetical protein [Solirubrobacteraceae bacterium]